MLATKRSMPRRYELFGASALGRAALDKNHQEKPPPMGDVPRGAASKDAGVGISQDVKSRSCGPFIPFGKAWRSQRAWHRARNSRHGWMLCFSFSLPTTGLTESQPRCISRRTDYARETEAAGLEPLRSVSPWSIWSCVAKMGIKMHLKCYLKDRQNGSNFVWYQYWYFVDSA